MTVFLRLFSPSFSFFASYFSFQPYNTNFFKGYSVNVTLYDDVHTGQFTCFITITSLSVTEAEQSPPLIVRPAHPKMAEHIKKFMPDYSVPLYVHSTQNERFNFYGRKKNNTYRVRILQPTRYCIVLRFSVYSCFEHLCDLISLRRIRYPEIFKNQYLRFATICINDPWKLEDGEICCSASCPPLPQLCTNVN